LLIENNECNEKSSYEAKIGKTSRVHAGFFYNVSSLQQRIEIIGLGLLGKASWKINSKEKVFLHEPGFGKTGLHLG
jgi:hypothetical protein